MLILFFAYFYTAIAFNPAQQADIIRKQGGFIPGIRPGPPTERYLAKVLNRITLPGALFLMVIALIPMFVLKFWNITQFPFGGTSILITVGVMLETMKQIDSQLMMRNYEGFLELSASLAKPRLVLLGKQGAGKGTQAARLGEYYGVAHLSTGEIFRAQASQGTAFGLEAKRYMDGGELVPDEIVVGVVEECLAPGGPLGDGFVLDGFPRTLHQAKELDRVLDGRPLDLAINLDVPRDIVLDRLAGRRGVRELPAGVPREPAARGRLDLRHVRRPRRAARRRHRGSDRPPARALRRADRADHRLLPRARHARAGRRSRRGRRRVQAPRRSRRRPSLRVAASYDRGLFAQDRSGRRSPARCGRCARQAVVVAEMHEACALAAKPGATTGDLDAAAREVLDRRGRASNFLDYHGFPAVACISPNEVIVHGIPGDRVIDDGDIVSIDCGAIVEGWHADAAITIPVGDDRRRVAPAARHDQGRARRRDRGGRRRQPARRHRRRGRGRGRAPAGFSVVREYVGHGIGTAMHEDPEVPNYGPAGRGLRLREGMVLAIEPMVNAGQARRPGCSTTAGPS